MSRVVDSKPGFERSESDLGVARLPAPLRGTPKYSTFVRVRNDTRKGILRDALKRAYETGEPVPWLLTEIRVRGFGMSTPEYAVHTGISRSLISKMETTAPSARFAASEVYRRLLGAWDRKIETIKDPLRREFLEEQRERFLGHVLFGSHGTTIGVMLRWLQEHGPHAFERATGITRKALVQRRYTGSFLSYYELDQFADRLGLYEDRNGAPAPEAVKGSSAYWKSATVRLIRRAFIHESLALGRSYPMILLHIGLGVAGTPPTMPGIRADGRFSVTEQAAEKLARFEPPRWHEVRELVRSLRAGEFLTERMAKEIEERWPAAEKAERSRLSYRIKFARELRKRGMPNHFLAHEVFGLPGKEGTNQVRSAVIEGISSRKAPYGHIAMLASDTPAELAKFLEARRNDLAFAYRRRTGHSMLASSIEADIWGLTKQEYGKNAPATALERLGISRADKPLRTFTSRFLCSTPAAVIGEMESRIGAFPLWSRGKTSPEMLKRIIAGEAVPSLTEYAQILAAGKTFLTPAREAGWRAEYPKYIVPDAAKPTPLGFVQKRIGFTLAAEAAATPVAFIRGRGGNIPTENRYFVFLNNEPEIQSAHFRHLLEFSGVTSGTERAAALNSVLRERSFQTGFLRWLEGRERIGDQELRRSVERVVAAAGIRLAPLMLRQWESYADGISARRDLARLPRLETDGREGLGSQLARDLLAIMRLFPGIRLHEMENALKEYAGDLAVKIPIRLYREEFAWMDRADKVLRNAPLSEPPQGRSGAVPQEVFSVLSERSTVGKLMTALDPRRPLASLLGVDGPPALTPVEGKLVLDAAVEKLIPNLTLSDSSLTDLRRSMRRVFKVTDTVRLLRSMGETVRQAEKLSLVEIPEQLNVPELIDLTLRLAAKTMRKFETAWK